MNQEFPNVQAGLEKAENQRPNCQHPLDHRKSKRIPNKTSTSASLTTLKPLTVWITTNRGKFLRGEDTRPSYLPLVNPACRSRSNS